MKTKIRTLITVCLLAFVGVVTANATVNSDKKNSAMNSDWTMFSAEINESIDYQKEAQLVTRWIADRAEAKVTQQLIERNSFLPGEAADYFENEVANESNDDVTDFRKEAQLVTKAIADKQETNTIDKLVTEGKLVEYR